jgi:hypothetical protein
VIPFSKYILFSKNYNWAFFLVKREQQSTWRTGLGQIQLAENVSDPDLHGSTINLSQGSRTKVVK